jgi:pimeloyl-ACP methyl ester carboxylesterase
VPGCGDAVARLKTPLVPRALGLAYAEAHPDRVIGLVLRGIFLCRPRDVHWFYQSGADRLFPEAWSRLAPGLAIWAAVSVLFGSLAAIAQVAPLVGLLGTLRGMATTFHAFMVQGGDYATARALSGGMWQALLVTIGSLTVAIPAHLGHHFLAGRVRGIVRDVEWAGNEIMRYLLTDYRQGASSPEPAPSPPPAP